METNKAPNQNIMDRVKTFEDACAITGTNPETLFHESDDEVERAEKKIKVIVKALNEGKELDVLDRGIYKYYPYFYISSGGGFSFRGYGCASTFSDVGARLLLHSEELATYAGEQFTDLYKTYLTGK